MKVIFLIFYIIFFLNFKNFLKIFKFLFENFLMAKIFLEPPKILGHGPPMMAQAQISEEVDNDLAIMEGDTESQASESSSTCSTKLTSKFSSTSSINPKHSTSEVWEHFRLKTSVTGKIANCNACGADLTYSGTTSNLFNHLRNKHPLLVHSATKRKASDEHVQLKTGPLDKFFGGTKPYKADSQKAKEITKKLQRLITQQMLPLSFVDSVAFRDFVNSLDQRYQPPSRKTLKGLILEEQTESLNQIQQSLKEVDAFAITTDTWTSIANESYIGVTCHYIDTEWKLLSKCLAVRSHPERHTGENLALSLKEILEQFLPGKVPVGCVTDNGLNISGAVAFLQWTHIPCFAHTLQLRLRLAFKEESISNLLARCRSIVGHFKHSSTASSELSSLAQQSGLQFTKLIQEVPTRWNSTFNMLDRIYMLRGPLSTILISSKKKSIRDMMLNGDEIDLCSKFIEILKPINLITEKLCADSLPTLSSIFPILVNLIENILQNPPDDSLIRFCSTLRNELEVRFYKLSDFLIFMSLTSLLDPRFKSLLFLSPERRNDAHTMLTDRLIAFIPTCEASKSTPSEPNNTDELQLLFGSSLVKSQDTTAVTSPLIEFERYCSEPSIALSSNPLDWWRANASRFPLLARMARTYLCVPATSVPCERLFSESGYVINKNRSRLTSKIAEALIQLHHNNR